MRDLRPKSIWRPPDQYQYMLRVMTNLEKRDFVKEAREKSFVPVFRADVSFFAGKEVNIKLKRLQKMSARRNDDKR